MNAVEIEEAISALADKPFDPVEFPYAFLEAFGRKDVTLKRLRTGDMNKSDMGGVLQRDNIHIAVAAPGAVGKTMDALRSSPATARWKAKFIVATDGDSFEAEEIGTTEAPIVCDYPSFPDHFGFFLPLAGISTVKQIRESAFDIKATGRLNRLYVELLKDNPAWDTEARREEMNHFMARLIFCFFAEDTGIFTGNALFTNTVATMSAKDGITHEVISTIFTAMNTKGEERATKKLPRWVDDFPYVNGGLFSGSTEVPRFSKIARSYLLNVGALDWKKVNPDIFGSMIQAVADDEERGALGMHYTSVPNILKVLNPLFLDDLHEKLAEAGDNSRKLLNLRNRMARIRVFDPACGSGNFLVIAYREMRAIEAEINERRGEADRATDIPKTNFRGIELRNFPAEIARLALIIAEYQADVQYRGPKMALAEVLPLDSENWITCGNALRLDWLSVCPPTGTGVRHHAEDLFHTPLDQAQIDFENEGGETYICGNPPYIGYYRQDDSQKSDLNALLGNATKNWKSLDYISGWFFKALGACRHGFDAAFVSTNSLCQGEQAAILWPLLFDGGVNITFAVPDFRWSNNASHNAVVNVSIVGLSLKKNYTRYIFDDGHKKSVPYINQYLINSSPIDIQPMSKNPLNRPLMVLGNMAKDGGNLILSQEEGRVAVEKDKRVAPYLFDFIGSQEFVKGFKRKCLWIDDNAVSDARNIAFIDERLKRVTAMRKASDAESTRSSANQPHRFKQIQGSPLKPCMIVPRHTSENRDYLPVGLLPVGTVLADSALGIFDAPLWCLSLIASSLHRTWIATVCGKIKSDFRYSSTLGWNTFPIPTLTEKNKADLTRCAEDILLAREAHFPATIADLYEVKDGVPQMPTDLRAAHERNDEVLERIYIGRRFKNDTERLEKLFELYTKMTAAQGAAMKTTKARARA